jgi:DNA-binding transcriptional ArsR family regulator
MDSLTALADPTRQRIVEMLARGPLCAGDIAKRFPSSAPAISQHLKTLRSAKLVRVHVDAQRRIYELDPSGLNELSGWVNEIRSFWGAKLESLEAQLKKEDKK